MSLVEVRLTFDCDKCGLHFSVLGSPNGGDDFVEQAVRLSAGYTDTVLPMRYTQSSILADGSVLCGICTHEREGTP
jgi:hypothetical protein